MTPRGIKKVELSDFLTSLIEHYRVYAPVRQQDMTSFQLISSPQQADFRQANTTLSPKSLMLPQSESMFHFTLEPNSEQAGILRQIEKDRRHRVIFGIRPCDAKSFHLLDLNFDTETYKDPWWVQRRQQTTLVGVGCKTPCSTCFCTSVNCGPFSTDGLDLLLTDVGDEWVVQILTSKGESLLSYGGIEVQAPEEQKREVRALQESTTQSMQPVISTDYLRQHQVQALFNAGFWDDVQFACINCGICTFVCPTCWCFDIQDEVHKRNGIRLRNWDACMFPLFTLHGSGHNPRAQKLQRVRQRFMHKLKYFADKYHRGVACVGCGRCVQHCPVNIDIREIFTWMNNLPV